MGFLEKGQYKYKKKREVKGSILTCADFIVLGKGPPLELRDIQDH